MALIRPEISLIAQNDAGCNTYMSLEVTPSREDGWILFYRVREGPSYERTNHRSH